VSSGVNDVVGSAPAEASAADVVRRFLEVLAAGDVDAAAELVDEDLVYENVSLPTIRGRRRFEQAFRSFAHRGIGFDVRIHRIAESGGSVLTERTDALSWGRFRTQFWVCGAFEVEQGRIVLWRDYFDWQAILTATARGIAGLAVPALRARFADES
jgi:limonene-1,2-epoxide hydrolase